MYVCVCVCVFVYMCNCLCEYLYWFKRMLVYMRLSNKVLCIYVTGLVNWKSWVASLSD